MKAARFAAVGLVVAASAWIASGHLFPHETAESKAAVRAAESDAKAFRVAVVPALVEPRSRKLVLSGRTEADRKMMVTARASGVVSELKVRRGQFVKQGDVIAILSDEARESQVAQARAMLTQRKAELEAKMKLVAQGTLPRLEQGNWEAQYKAAEAGARDRRGGARARRRACALVGRGQRGAGRNRAGGVLDGRQGDRADRLARSDHRGRRGRRAQAARPQARRSGRHPPRHRPYGAGQDPLHLEDREPGDAHLSGRRRDPQCRTATSRTASPPR